MPRRPPARVRADAWYQPIPSHVMSGPANQILGLSPRARAVIVRLERTRFWPGAVAQALDSWRRFVRDPVHRLWDPSYGCGVPECCPDPAQLRAILAAAAHTLPPKDARELRRRIAALDELW